MPNPEVYKSATSNTYIIFGEVKIEDLSQQAATTAASQIQRAKEEASTQRAEATKQAKEEEEDAQDEDDDDEEEDTEGIEEKDIELVINQADVSRKKAIRALKNVGGDIVNAIMVRPSILLMCSILWSWRFNMGTARVGPYGGMTRKVSVRRVGLSSRALWCRHRI